MPNNNYARGASFERRFVKWLRERQHVAGRCAGSHGSFDVFSMHRGMSFLYQLKTGTARVALEDRKCLREDADLAGALSFVVRTKRGGFDLFSVSSKLELIPATPLTIEQPF